MAKQERQQNISDGVILKENIKIEDKFIFSSVCSQPLEVYYLQTTYVASILAWTELEVCKSNLKDVIFEKSESN